MSCGKFIPDVAYGGTSRHIRGPCNKVGMFPVEHLNS